MRNYLAVTALLLIVFFACGPKETTPTPTAKDYYFPYSTFAKGVTYHYEEKGDSTLKSDWEMKMETTGTDTFLNINILDQNGQLTDYIKEKITPTESVIESYRLYFTKDIFSECKMKQRVAYKWSVKKDEAYRWFAQYAMPDNSADIDYSKTRIFTGDTTEIYYGGNNHQCLVFTDIYSMKGVSRKDGKADSLEYSMNSYYAKDLGLISYKLKLPDGATKEFNLKSVTTN